MKKLLLNIAAALMVFSLACCTNGFNRDKAEDILQKKEISSEEYDVLLEQYEFGIDDAIRLSKLDREKLTEDDHQEIITMFAIGKRLAIDEDKLSEEQQKEFSRITNKGTEELSK